MFGGRTATEYAEECRAAGVDGHVDTVSKAFYDNLVEHRAQLLNAVLVPLRALLDYDETVMSQVICADAPRPSTGLPEAIRAAAPAVQQKGDWAALYMLLREKGMDVGYTELCRLIAEYAPDAPQPTKNHIASAEWDTHRRRFPDWKPEGVRYDKFRRHYMVANRACVLLT